VKANSRVIYATGQETVGMTKQKPCMKVQLIKPSGETAYTADFDTSTEAESRYERLVSACDKDAWSGARVQCLDANGTIVREHIISTWLITVMVQQMVQQIVAVHAMGVVS
jgi:hypothetical protein